MGKKLKPNIPRVLKQRSVLNLKKKGLTQAQIAEKTQLSISTVARWLKKAGQTNPQKKGSTKCACKKVVRNPVLDRGVADAFKKANTLHHLLLAQGENAPSVQALAKALSVAALLEGKYHE